MSIVEGLKEGHRILSGWSKGMKGIGEGIYLYVHMCGRLYICERVVVCIRVCIHLCLCVSVWNHIGSCKSFLHPDS